MLAGNGDISCCRADEINLRGQFIAGADGRFSFTTSVPAHYADRCHLPWRILDQPPAYIYRRV